MTSPFRWDTHNGKPRLRKIVPHPGKRHGCIVTADIDGELRTYYRPGLVSEALTDIVGQLPAGARVETISTEASIRLDLRGPRSDPWQNERQLLAKIGRLDLLPDKAIRAGRAA